MAQKNVPLVSLCMIVRDEESDLERCLASVKGVADEVVIYDTGSVDGTIELARRLGATVIEGYWDDDFSRARNAALAECSGRWILHLDADEELVAGQGLRSALSTSSHDGVLVPIRNVGAQWGDFTHNVIRLFRSKAARWTGRLHERPVSRMPKRDLQVTELDDVSILHHGYSAEAISNRSKSERNIRIAQAEVDAAADSANSQDRARLFLNLARSLEPAGSGQLEADSEIPRERTSSPYDVIDAFSGLAETSEEIDTDQLAESLTTLADLTRNTPEEFKSALSGVSALSSNIAARDTQINSLLKNLRKVSGVLNARDQDIVALMKDSDVLFRALVQRREAVHNLLVSTSTLSKELTALVKQSRADLNPALTHLSNVVDVLNKNEDNLDNSLRLMAPFYRVFANTLGNGPWFDTYIQNLPPVPQAG